MNDNETNIPGLMMAAETTAPCSSEEIVRQIHQELNHISITSCQIFTNGNHKYKCKFIFHAVELAELKTRQHLLTLDPSCFEVIDSSDVTHKGKQTIDHDDDLYIKAGLFVRLLKQYLTTNGLGIIKKKYFDTNTYVSTFKLGIKVNNIKPSTSSSSSSVPQFPRGVVYIKLRESLEFVCQGLVGVHPMSVDNLLNTASMSNFGSTFSAYNKSESLRECASFLANKMHLVESEIAEYLIDKIQSSSLTFESIESIEVLLSQFLTSSDSYDSEVMNRIRKRLKSENEYNFTDHSMFVLENSIEDCLAHLQEIKKNRNV